MNKLKRILDILIPRFVTEDFIMEQQGEYLEPTIPVSYFLYVEDEEYENFVPQWVSSVRCFNLFGFGLFAKIGEPVPWSVYKRFIGI